MSGKLVIDFAVGEYAIKDLEIAAKDIQKEIVFLNRAEYSLSDGGKSCPNYNRIMNMITTSRNMANNEAERIYRVKSAYKDFLRYAEQKENECVKIIKADGKTFRVNKGMEVSGWVEGLEIAGTVVIVSGLIAATIFTGGSALLICASIGAAAGAGIGYYKNKDTKNPWGHALFGAIKGGATGAMIGQAGPQLLAAGSQLSTVGLSGTVLKTAAKKYAAEIFTKTTLKETVAGVAGQGVFQTIDSGIEGLIDDGIHGLKVNALKAVENFFRPENLIETACFTAVLAPGLKKIKTVEHAKVPEGLDDNVNAESELRERILKNIEESKKARESSGYKEWSDCFKEGYSDYADGLSLGDRFKYIDNNNKKFFNEFTERSSKAGLNSEQIDAAYKAMRSGDYKTMAKYFDTSCPKDGAYFWSGNKEGAMDYASSRGGTIMEMTPGGQVFDNWKGLGGMYPEWQTDTALDQRPIWEALSAQYAKSAKGNVSYLHTIRDGKPYYGSVWLDIEREALRRNAKKGIITNIEEVFINE